MGRNRDISEASGGRASTARPPATPAAPPPVPPPAPPIGDVAAYRLWYREHVRPRRYFPRLHVLMHLATVLCGSAYALSHVHDATLLDWLAIPVGLFNGSLFVYFFHKEVLHRPRRLLHAFYVKHTLEHHRFYSYDAITPDERNDLHITLFPWWSGMVIAGSFYGLVQALEPLLGTNFAHLSMFMAFVHFGLYELVHSVSHLPDDHLLVRVPPFAFLRHHHRLHHDPALMGKHNFNIVLPLFDWLLGAAVTRR